MGGHAALVLDETRQPPPGAHRIGTKTLDHRVVDDLLQPPAMDGELRHVVARMHPAQLAPDLLALPGEVGQLPCAHRHLVERVEQPKL